MPTKHFVQMILVGPMGAGKSTIGKKLAEILGYQFYDSDCEIEKRSGRDIFSLFNESERDFRYFESIVLKDLIKNEQAIIATGGGAILSASNRALLRATKSVVYLTANAQTIFNRLQGDRTRPLLQHGERYQTIQTILASRDKLYQQVANVSLKTDDKTPSSIVDAIIYDYKEAWVEHH